MEALAHHFIAPNQHAANRRVRGGETDGPLGLL
jgi:hypothetical protein